MIKPWNCKACLKQFETLAEMTQHVCEPIVGLEARKKAIQERDTQSAKR